MTNVSPTIWTIEEHTKAKHEILKRYLYPWYGALGSSKKRIIYFDGFCGPGKYIGGEPGSPIIAIEIALQMSKKLSNTEVIFVFVDESKERIAHLKNEIKRYSIPNNFKIEMRNNSFANVLTEILDKVSSSKINIAPTFAFVDPFGWKGLPFNLLERLLKYPKTEVFVNLMIDSINRFIEHPILQNRRHIQDLFGASEEEITQALSSGERVENLTILYQNKLKGSAEFVRYFQMRNIDNRVIYNLFFASNHRLGHLKMKESFWKVDNESGFSFSDNTDNKQLVLFKINPCEKVAEILVNKFSGNTIESQVIVDYIIDETPYIEKHAKGALRHLEANKLIQVEKTKKDGTPRTHGFANGVIIHF